MAKLHAAPDISQTSTAVCVVEASGALVFDGGVDSSPAAIAKMLRPYKRRLASLGHEAGLFTPWMYNELLRRGLKSLSTEAGASTQLGFDEFQMARKAEFDANYVLF